MGTDRAAAVIDRKQEATGECGQPWIGTDRTIECRHDRIGVGYRIWVPPRERARDDVAHPLMRRGWEQTCLREHLRAATTVSRQPANLHGSPRRQIHDPVSEPGARGKGSQAGGIEPPARQPDPREVSVSGFVQAQNPGTPVPRRRLVSLDQDREREERSAARPGIIEVPPGKNAFP